MTEFDIPWLQPETMPATTTELFDESPFEATQFGAAAAAEFPGLPAESGVSSEWLVPDACAQKVKSLRVAVVGGGFAGLLAARTLCRLGAKVALFEAREEVGGRVLSDYGKFSRGRITEFGAELVGSIHTRWCQLAIEYGLALISRMNTDLYRGQQLNVKLTLDKPLTMDEIRAVDEEMEKVQRKIAVLATGMGDPSQPWLRDNISDVDKKKYDNMSVAAALEKMFGVPPGGRLWKNFEMLLVNNNVAPLENLNFLGLLCLVRGGQSGTIGQGADRLMGYWKELEIYRCADGCQKLALMIKDEIQARRHPPADRRCEILLHRAVTDITLRKDGDVEVVSRNVRDDKPVGPAIPGVYDYVILAIPPSVWDKVTITPVHPKEPSQVGLMGMGDAVKFFSDVKNRFWIKAGAAPYGGSPTLGQVWEGTDNQTQIGDQGIVLSVFAGGPGARTPEKDFKSELTKLYRGYPKSPKTHLANWPKEPFIKTGYASPGLGQILTVGKLLNEPFKPFSGRLLFAGEHTQMGYFGYMEGALRSGELAAQQLIKHACDQPRNRPPAAPGAAGRVLVAGVAPRREAEDLLSGEETDDEWGAASDDEAWDGLSPAFGLGPADLAGADEQSEDLFEAEELARHAVYEAVSDDEASIVGTGRTAQELELETMEMGAQPPIRTTSQLRAAWHADECAEHRMIPIRLFGKWDTPVNPATVDAWRALEQTLDAGGYRAHRAGVYNCREIGGQNTRSLHAYGLAIDIDHTNPQCNVNRATPDKRVVRFSSATTKEERCRDVDEGRADTSFTPGQVAAVEAIRTVDGHQVFAWGGRWRTTKDTMHFQINVTPEELARGIQPDSVGQVNAEAPVGTLEAGNESPFMELAPDSDGFEDWLTEKVTPDEQVPGALAKWPPAPYSTMPLGVDLSDAQASCPGGRCTPLPRSAFQRLVRLRKAFAILKASQYQADQTFRAHYQLAREVGLIRGGYHLFTERPVQDQVRLFLGLVPRLGPGELPPSLDVEDPDKANLPLFNHYHYTHKGQGSPAGTQALLDALQQWLDRVEAALGRTPIIYTGAMWRDDLRSKRMSQYPLWTIPNRLPFGGWGSRADILQYAEDGQNWLGQARYREPGVDIAGIDYDSYNGTIYGLRGLADLGRVGVALTQLGAVIAHCEVDRHVHLLHESTWRTWTDSDLMNGALPSLGGDPTLFAVGTGVVLYFRDDGRVVEAVQPAPSAAWDFEDLTSVAGVKAVHDPRAIMVGGQRFVAFSGDDDDWHLLTRQATGSWTVSHLLSQARREAITSVPESSGQPTLYVVSGSPNPRVVGRAGPTGDLVELALGPSGWQATSLNGVVTGPGGSPPAATYSPGIYQTAAETFIVYRAVRGQLWQIARGARRATNLSAAAVGSVPAVGHPTCFVLGDQAHVVYRGVDRSIHDISYRGGSWSDHVLPCGVPAASDPTCTADGSTALVAFRGTDGMVRAGRFDGSMWTCADTVRSQTAAGGIQVEPPTIPPGSAENTAAVVSTLVPETPWDVPPSSEQSEASPQPIAQVGATAFPHMAFQHILLESRDPATIAMVPGVVPATPAALTTSFYDAAASGTTPDSAFQQALTNLINSKPAYKNVGKNLAVSLVDLSGANKFTPKYAGFNDLANFYGASVNKITGLLGVYQLLAEANELLKAQPTLITDSVGLENAFSTRWTQAGIDAQHHPLVAKILEVRPGSPPTAALHPDLVARLRRISSGNQNGSTPIVLLKFPFIGSTLLAHGLFSPTNKGGLWTRQAYGKISYRGQNLSLPNWSAKENPYPTTEVHNINAVSVAQFYTLAAQRRMIDDATSKAVLGHLQTGGCTTLIDVKALFASGQVATKCGIFPEDSAQWVHNSVHFKETATLREFVVVILTKNATFGIMKNLFNDLVALVP